MDPPRAPRRPRPADRAAQPRGLHATSSTHALERHARSRLHLGVLFIDLDAFKQINDSVGHEAGDRLLGRGRRAAARARCAPATSSRRLGGDEFAILLELLETDHEAVDDRAPRDRGVRRAVRARRPGRSR